MVMHSNWARQYGSVYRIWVGPQLAIFVTDPKAVETVLGSAKLIDKSSLYDFLVPWLGRGLLLSTGKKWFTRRRIITPTFHFKILEQFVEIFDQQSNVLIKKLKNDFKPNTAFDIYPLITLFALDVVCGMYTLSLYNRFYCQFKYINIDCNLIYRNCDGYQDKCSN